MNTGELFYEVVICDAEGVPTSFLGTAFAVSPSGALATCRHVVDVDLGEGEAIGVVTAARTVARVAEVRVPADGSIDLAFLVGAMGNKDSYFPLLPVSEVHVGQDIYSYGFYLSSGERLRPDAGYFKGNIVGVSTRHDPPHQTILASYPIVEGLSGSPILTYHHGVKVVGLAFGSLSSRVLAAEVIEARSEDSHYLETVNRIVEFGLAHQSATLGAAAQELGIPVLIEAGRTDIPGVE